MKEYPRGYFIGVIISYLIFFANICFFGILSGSIIFGLEIIAAMIFIDFKNELEKIREIKKINKQEWDKIKKTWNESQNLQNKKEVNKNDIRRN